MKTRLSAISGVGANTIADIAIAGSIIDLDKSVLSQVMFGNVDYANPEDELTQRYQAYQYSTFWGTTVNKIYPSWKTGRGRDLITHYLKLYPSPWTKRANKWLTGRKPKVVNKKTVYDANASNALDLIKSGAFG